MPNDETSQKDKDPTTDAHAGGEPTSKDKDPTADAHAGGEPSSKDKEPAADAHAGGEPSSKDKDPTADARSGRRPTSETVGDENDSVRQRLESLIPELVRRTVTAGLGAVMSTEEGVRKFTKDYALPREVASYLLNTAGSTKDEIVQIFAREIREFLQGLNINNELAKLLTQLSFEIKTEIRFIPNDESVMGVKPNIKNEVGIKRDKSEAQDVPETD